MKEEISNETVQFSDNAKIKELEKELDEYKKKYFDQQSQLFRCRTAIKSLIEGLSILKEYM